jgi:hypothetical protein
VLLGGTFVAIVLHPAFVSQEPLDDDGDRYRRLRGCSSPERWWIESFGGPGATTARSRRTSKP